MTAVMNQTPGTAGSIEGPGVRIDSLDGALVTTRSALARGVDPRLREGRTDGEPLQGFGRGNLVELVGGGDGVAEATMAGDAFTVDGPRTSPESGSDTGRNPRPLPCLGKRFGLSVREAEVMICVAHGLTNEQVADRMFLGVNTIKTHLRKAYRKVGVKTRSEAVLWGIANNLHPALGPRPMVSGQSLVTMRVSSTGSAGERGPT